MIQRIAQSLRFFVSGIAPADILVHLRAGACGGRYHAAELPYMAGRREHKRACRDLFAGIGGKQLAAPFAAVICRRAVFRACGLDAAAERRIAVSECRNGLRLFNFKAGIGGKQSAAIFAFVVARCAAPGTCGLLCADIGQPVAVRRSLYSTFIAAMIPRTCGKARCAQCGRCKQ